MDEVEYEFVGNAECPLCGALAGTTDSKPIPPPHPNCQCSHEPVCNNTYDASHHTRRYGPGRGCFEIYAEITVTCWNGQEIGATVPVDFGCDANELRIELIVERMDEAVAAEAQSMADGCPDCNPNVS